MRFLIRLLGALWLATLLVSAGFAWYEVHAERRRLIDDLHRRAALAADAVREASERQVARGSRTGYERVLARFGRQDRAVALYDAFGSVIEASPEVKRALGPISPLVSEAITKNQPARAFAAVNGRTRLVYVLPLQQDDGPIGAAAVLLDAEYLESAEWALWQRTAVRIGVLMLLLTGITWILVRWSVTRPMARIAEWTKQLKSGQPVAPPPNADVSLFGPLATEVTGLARTLNRARLAAAEEARLRLAGESLWTEERLKQFVEIRFGERPIYVVSNREPVSHVHDGRTIAEVRPASGLVTALEPIMLACGGTWVAHGVGGQGGPALQVVGQALPLGLHLGPREARADE
jgi:trehalose 6-phosphate synthase